MVDRFGREHGEFLAHHRLPPVGMRAAGERRRLAACYSGVRRGVNAPHRLTIAVLHCDSLPQTGEYSKAAKLLTGHSVSLKLQLSRRATKRTSRRPAMRRAAARPKAPHPGCASRLRVPGGPGGDAGRG